MFNFDWELKQRNLEFLQHKHETQTTHRHETESITPEERTKWSDRYREDEALMCLTMVTGVRDNQQPDDLEAREGVYVTTI